MPKAKELIKEIDNMEVIAVNEDDMTVAELKQMLKSKEAAEVQFQNTLTSYREALEYAQKAGKESIEELKKDYNDLHAYTKQVISINKSTLEGIGLVLQGLIRLTVPKAEETAEKGEN